MVNAFGNKVFFKMSSDTATEISDIIGKHEKIEYSKSFSHRFGFSFSEQRKREKLLMASELADIDDLNAVVKFTNSKWMKSTWTYKEYPDTNIESFIYRKKKYKFFEKRI